MTKIPQQAVLEGLPPGFIWGCTLSNNVGDPTNDIDIAAGYCKSTDLKYDIVVPVRVKQLDVAYAAGTNAGGRFDTSIANGTWHVFVITNGTVTDIGFGTTVNPTSLPNYPAGYSYRRIGSIVRVSAAIKGFIQDGDYFAWKAPAIDMTSGSWPAGDTLVGLTIPTGLVVEAEITAVGTTAGGNGLFAIFNPAIDSTGVGIALATSRGVSGTFHQASGILRVRTNTSGQVRIRSNDASATGDIGTRGWTDTRGRLAA